MLPGFYAMARAFVNPSTIEPFGQTLIEAQACGTPVVGYGGDPRQFFTATDEILVDGRTGVVVRELGPSELAKKIDSILALNDNDYSVMSSHARENVRERFSWSQFVQAALELSSHRPLGKG